MQKLVIGLRQVAASMIAQADARMEDSGAESKGFLSEAVEQYADRINGYASELAAEIGFVEASPDLRAARELAGTVVSRLANRPGAVKVRLSQTLTMHAHAAVEAILAGDLDDSDIVQDMLLAIERGRELAGEAHQRQRMAEMMAAPAAPSVPNRLTITVDGPPGSVKTKTAEFLVGLFPTTIRPPYSESTVVMAPTVFEMRDGRPFDVRNQIFPNMAVA